MAIISEDERRAMEQNALRDYKQFYKDAVRRIGELERLNSALAAQVDRQARVVEAALAVTRSLRGTADWSAEESALEYAARMYQQHMAQLAKRAGEGDGENRNYN
jgi:hypothetical protein